MAAPPSGARSTAAASAAASISDETFPRQNFSSPFEESQKGVPSRPRAGTQRKIQFEHQQHCRPLLPRSSVQIQVEGNQTSHVMDRVYPSQRHPEALKSQRA